MEQSENNFLSYRFEINVKQQNLHYFYGPDPNNGANGTRFVWPVVCIFVLNNNPEASTSSR